MLFSSLLFLLWFFPLFFLCYYAVTGLCRLWAKKKNLSRVPTLPRNAVLLFFSLLFYAFGEVRYLWLLVLSILVNWLGAILLDTAREKGRAGLSRLFLILSVIFNLAMLGVYKYLPLFVTSFNDLAGMSLTVPSLTLPIGISFFTFQIMSYVIDVYRGDVRVQENPFTVAVYLCAFPQLIAGPIVRYADVERELAERTETLDGTAAGLRRFLMGLGKKVIVANTVAAVADGIYSYAPAEYGVLGAWIAAIAYTLQIYYDFSGYSDMAIGMGRMMGFHYLENFDHPYSAVSVTDFWRRWHKSLSFFFRDYVYIPLGGNRVSVPRWIFNMMIVWGLTGFWHGASWNFALWGLYYGVLLILEKKVFGKVFAKVPVLSRILTLFFVVFGWVIFRVEDLPTLGQAVAALFGGYGMGEGIGIFTILRRVECGGFFLVISFVAVLLSFEGGIAGKARRALGFSDGSEPGKAGAILADLFCVLLLLLSIVMLETGSYNPFIYFRF